VKPAQIQEMIECIKKEIAAVGTEKAGAAGQFYAQTEAAIRFKASKNDKYTPLLEYLS